MLGELLPVADDLRHARQTLHERFERRGHRNNDPGAPQSKQRHIAAGLEGVSEALLVIDEQSLAIQVVVPQP